MNMTIIETILLISALSALLLEAMSDGSDTIEIARLGKDHRAALEIARAGLARASTQENDAPPQV